TKADIEAMKLNVAEIQRQVREAEGLVGAVLNDPATRSEISKTMRETRDAMAAVEKDYAAIEAKAKRTMGDVEKAAGKIEAIVDGLDDPKNTSLVAVLFNEGSAIQADAARLSDHTSEAIGAGREAITDINAVLAD